MIFAKKNRIIDNFHSFKFHTQWFSLVCIKFNPAVVFMISEMSFWRTHVAYRHDSAGRWALRLCCLWGVGGHSLGVFSVLIVNGPWGRTVIGLYLCWVRAMINWYHPWVYVHAHINAHVHTQARAKTRREPPCRACVAVRLSGELS